MSKGQCPRKASKSTRTEILTNLFDHNYAAFVHRLNASLKTVVSITSPALNSSRGVAEENSINQGKQIMHVCV